MTGMWCCYAASKNRTEGNSVTMGIPNGPIFNVKALFQRHLNWFKYDEVTVCCIVCRSSLIILVYIHNSYVWNKVLHDQVDLRCLSLIWESNRSIQCFICKGTFYFHQKHRYRKVKSGILIVKFDTDNWGEKKKRWQS